MSPRPPREGLRDEILDAAEGILVRTGSEDAVSIRAVGAAVGVTAPSIYRHFDDKQHLIFEVCTRQFGRLREYVEKAVAGIDDPVEVVLTLGRAYVRFGLENPEQYRVLFMGRSDLTPEQYADEQILETGAFGVLVDAVARCVEAGRFRPEHDDPLPLSFALWAAVHGVVSLAVAKPNVPGPPVEERLETMFELLLRGALAEGATEGAPERAPRPARYRRRER